MSDPTRRTKPWHGVLVATALPMRPSGDDPLAVDLDPRTTTETTTSTSVKAARRI